MNPEAQARDEQPQTVWRLRLGIFIFVIGFASPLLIPVVTATDLPAGWKTFISGALAVGIPEVFSIIAIAIMGKSGFNAIKARLFAFLKKHGPPDRVGRTRYRVGLVMFVLPLLFGWLGAYFIHRIPDYEIYRIPVSLAGDLLLVASLFVLGGDFWDKVRALFIHDAVVEIGR